MYALIITDGNGYCTTIIPINYDTCNDQAPDNCARPCNWNTETGFKSSHPGGAHFLFGDGSVHLVQQTIDHQTYQYLATTAPTIAKISTLGGWAQLKATVNSRNEFNVAAGYGGFNSSNLRNAAATDASLLFVPARNQSMLINYVFKPRSDLVFSLEYRKLRTYDVLEEPYKADHVGAAAAFLF